MTAMERKTHIFIGYYGSGKTELAINYATQLAGSSQPVALVDLDIVNLYFRSRETKDVLAAKGVEVIVSPGNLAQADLPALSPAILGVLQREGLKVVFDVGGDDAGATALGRFVRYIPEGSYNLFFVVNTYRPFTRTKAEIIKALRAIEAASRLKVTHLVSNSNLGGETDRECIVEGLSLVKEVAGELGLPVAFAGVPESLASQMEAELGNVPLMPLQLYMVPHWLREERWVITDPRSKLRDARGK